MKSIKVCEYSRSRSFHNDLILQDQASGERSQDQWSSGTIFVAKTKALISCAVTAQLICGFVFAYANCWFSHKAAHLFHYNTRFGIICSISNLSTII